MNFWAAAPVPGLGPGIAGMMALMIFCEAVDSRFV
jgi:hypothetical protein